MKNNNKIYQIQKVIIGGSPLSRLENSQGTRNQITQLRQYPLLLVEQGKQIDWQELFDPNNHRTIFQTILDDRECRVDQREIMCDRPPFAVVTVTENGIERVEYYEGHDRLEMLYDLRSHNFRTRKFPNYIDKDPQPYRIEKDFPANLPNVFKFEMKQMVNEGHARIRKGYGLDNPNTYGDIRFPTLMKAFGDTVEEHRTSFQMAAIGCLFKPILAS
jgi:hypothetical protein